MTSSAPAAEHSNVLIVGGGTGGITVAGPGGPGPRQELTKRAPAPPPKKQPQF